MGPMRTALGLGLAGALLAGCQGGETADEAGDVPTTARALAWLAADHLGDPRSATAEDDAAEEFGGSGAVGTEMSIGQQLVLAVGRRLPPADFDCESERTEGLGGCVETGDGVLMWELETPEEDPGVVYVVVPKGDGAVLMFGSGTAITGDPRELDLPISVAEMFEVANDPRVDVTTTQEAVDGGRDLDYWRESDS